MTSSQVPALPRCPFATWSPTPSHSNREGAAIDLIVIHQTDGTPRAIQAVEGFQKPENQKSAHFVVGQAAEIFQLVELDRAAWHDQYRNKRSIGVEHSARRPGEFDAKWPALPQHTRAALLPSDVDPDGPTDPGFALTEPQLQASAKLVAWLLKRLDLGVDAVVPHCSNPQTSHRDCGLSVDHGGIWPWSDYIAAIIVELSRL